MLTNIIMFFQQPNLLNYCHITLILGSSQQKFLAYNPVYWVSRTTKLAFLLP
jgi:hypothetical protein